MTSAAKRQEFAAMKYAPFDKIKGVKSDMPNNFDAAPNTKRTSPKSMRLPVARFIKCLLFEYILWGSDREVNKKTQH